VIGGAARADRLLSGELGQVGIREGGGARGDIVESSG
jgi:hypothetical protein